MTLFQNLGREGQRGAQKFGSKRKAMMKGQGKQLNDLSTFPPMSVWAQGV